MRWISKLKTLNSKIKNQKSKILLLASCTCLLFLASCATYRVASYPPPRIDIGVPHRVEEGIASWYGMDFHGRPTASGDIYDMYKHTAAHRTVPLGTYARVTNLENGKNVRLLINDRGPFVDGRIIDLSFGAAKELGMADKGLGRVRIEYLERDKRYIKYVKFDERGYGDFTIQVGAFTNIDNAVRLKKALEWNYKDVSLTDTIINGTKYHRVRIGIFKSKQDASVLASKLADEGYSVTVMRSK
ncbi:MAG: septal ring lytic transglycosylase RlpA family protein [Nitrospirota bacterium]